MSQPNVPEEKKKLTFVSEGVSNLEQQKEREQKEQQKFEDEKLRKNRKSLRDQLRTNAISKQKEFKSQVRKREKFNRLSKEELEFFDSIKKKEEDKETELEEYLDKKSNDFDKKKRRLESEVGSGSIITGIETKELSKKKDILMPTNSIIRKKKKMLKVRIKTLEDK